MWTTEGIARLAKGFPPDGCAIGLYMAGDERLEMVATRGLYRRLPIAGAPWQATPTPNALLLSGPNVTFSGFVSRLPAVGFLVFQGDTLLFWEPFADGTPRQLVAEEDELVVKPYLALKAEV